VVIQGRLCGLPRYSPNKTILQIDVENIMTDKTWRPAEGKLQMTVRKACPYLKYGDEIEAKVKLSRPYNIRNPGAFDYERYMAAQKIFVTGYMSDGSDITLLHRSTGGFKTWIENTRQDISQRIGRLGEGGPEAEVLKALLLGERSAVPDNVNEAFARAGVAHLLAVSGLHLGIVASLAFWIVLWLLKRSEKLMLAVNVRRMAAILTLLPVAAYAELTGARIPTMRAEVMVSVYLIAAAIGRSSDLRSSIAVAAVVLLALWPASITDAGFLLSFTAVIAIAEVIPVLEYHYPKIDPINPTRRRRLWREYIIFPLTIGIAILVATAPLTARLFNQFQYISPISNLIFIPLVGYLVMSLGLISLILHPIWPMLGNWLLYLDLKLSNISIILIDWFAHAPGANKLAPTLSVFAVAMCFILVLSFLRFLGPPDPSRNIARILAALAAIGLFMDAGAWYIKKNTRGVIEATFLDAGDGNSALIISPEGKTILIDIGKEFVSSYLLYRHVPEIDVVAITHTHYDHISGLEYILKHFRVGEIWMADAAYPQYMAELVTKPAQLANVPVKKHAREDPPFKYGDVAIDVLWPPRGYKPPEIPYPDINSASLVLRISAGGMSFIFPGDIRADIQDKITSEPKAGRSMVMLAPHHAAKGSLSENFLRFINPRLAIVSVRWSEHRPYPNIGVLNLIAGSGIRVMRTDRDGAVQVRGDGDKLEVSHWTGSKWNRVETFESSR
jgi:competence protein ComEC